jgi:hypothetical protein
MQKSLLKFGKVNLIAKTRNFTLHMSKEHVTGLKNSNPLHLLQMRYRCVTLVVTLQIRIITTMLYFILMYCTTLKSKH